MTVRAVVFDLFHTLTGPESEWSNLPDRVPARLPLADHHIRSVPEILALLGVR